MLTQMIVIALFVGYDNSQKQYADHDGLDQPAKSGLISVVALILCGAFFGLLAGWLVAIFIFLIFTFEASYNLFYTFIFKPMFELKFSSNQNKPN